MILKSIFKDWTLPLSMVVGTISYVAAVALGMKWLAPKVHRFVAEKSKDYSWMAMTFLNPQAAIGPGACLLWQNVFNCWQIWIHQRSRLRG